MNGCGPARVGCRAYGMRYAYKKLGRFRFCPTVGAEFVLPILEL
jgi:hypothetical protein